MKKIVIFQAILIVFLVVYSYSSRLELRSLREIKSMGVVKSNVVYTSDVVGDSHYDEPVAESVGLSEPFDVNSDILERILMLRQHLLFQPSQEWVDDVITAAEFEIKNYRKQ